MSSRPLLGVSPSAGLLLLSIFFLPLSTAVVAICSFLSRLRPVSRSGSTGAGSARITHDRRRILITGAGTPAGLALARIFHQAGHEVIAAEHESLPGLSCARPSKAVKKLYRLRSNANAASTSSSTELLLDIVRRDRPALLIPCDPLTSPHEVAFMKTVVEKHTTCRILHYDLPTTELLIDDPSFVKSVSELHPQVRVPVARRVNSRGEIYQVLGTTTKGKRYRLEPVGDDRPKLRGGPSFTVRETFQGWQEKMLKQSAVQETPEDLGDDDERGEAVVLPRPTMNETYHRVADLQISKAKPWILHEVVEGIVCSASALAIDGAVRTFSASEHIPFGQGTSPNKKVSASADAVRPANLERKAGVKHKALPRDSALYNSLLAHMQSFAAHFSDKAATHVSLTFLVSESVASTGLETTVYPMACDMRPASSMALFAQDPDCIGRLSKAYLEAAKSPAVNGMPLEPALLVNGHKNEEIVAPPTPSSSPGQKSVALGTYSLPVALVQLVALPVLGLYKADGSLDAVAQGFLQLFELLLLWKEELFDWRDPWPWWWEWHARPILIWMSMALGTVRRGVVVPWKD